MTNKNSCQLHSSLSASGSKSVCFLATVINPSKKAEEFCLYLVLLGITSAYSALSRRSAFGVVHFSLLEAQFLPLPARWRFSSTRPRPLGCGHLPSISQKLLWMDSATIPTLRGCPFNTRFPNATCKTAFPQSPRLLLLPHCC